MYSNVIQALQLGRNKNTMCSNKNTIGINYTYQLIMQLSSLRENNNFVGAVFSKHSRAESSASTSLDLGKGLRLEVHK